MLPFNQYGLLSEGIHTMALPEFERVFGFNPKRLIMIQKGLTPFIKELAGMQVKEICLNGSFVTQADNPGDIDGYTITNLSSSLYESLIENQERWLMEYRVDFYPALTDLKGPMSKEWWEKKWFPSVPTDTNRKKGFIRLTI